MRERNAHAWVEVWLPSRGWVTMDPTPPAGVRRHMPQRSSFLGGVTDLFGVWWGLLRQRLAKMTLAELFLFLGAAILFWILLRVVRYLRSRQQDASSTGKIYDDPLPSLDELLRYLAAKFSPRRESEPLESYARRLAQENSTPKDSPSEAPARKDSRRKEESSQEDEAAQEAEPLRQKEALDGGEAAKVSADVTAYPADAPVEARRTSQKQPLSDPLPDAIDLLLDYASYRYGQHGDPGALEQRMQGWIQQHGARTLPPS